MPHKSRKAKHDDDVRRATRPATINVDLDTNGADSPNVTGTHETRPSSVLMGNSVLTVSTSSGYSTSDETAAVDADRLPRAPKSTKRKTRSSPASPNGTGSAERATAATSTSSSGPLLKRIKVDVGDDSSPAPGRSAGSGALVHKQQPQQSHQRQHHVVCSSKPPLPPAAKASIRNAATANGATRPTGANKSNQKAKRCPGAGGVGGGAAATAHQGTLLNKLNAYADQCRAENADLKAALATEKASVRALRAQMDADLRRMKTELKRSSVANPPSSANAGAGGATAPNRCGRQADGGAAEQTANVNQTTDAQLQSELKKLRTENCILRDANKQLEDKNQIFCKADRQKTNDVRQVKDSYELKLVQMSKSANVEIHRLLDEIKSKDKSLETLRKEAIDLRNSKKLEQHHQMQQQPHAHNNHHNQQQQSHQLQPPQPQQHLAIGGSHSDGTAGPMRKETTGESNNTNAISNTITYHQQQPPSICRINTTHDDDAELLNAHVMHERIPGTHINSYTSFCGTKDQPGSDNDSALSSAPPSLSPQPGIFSNSPDEWNLFAKDCKELQNLRKDFETTQEENQFLNFELAAAKEQIETLEKTIFEHTDGSKCDELYRQITQFERELERSQKEAYELREQNELLEFRNIELEESFEKSKAQLTTECDAQWRSTASGPVKTTAERMVATVQPYTSLSSDECERKSTVLRQSTPPQTGAVRAVCSQCTQTELPDICTADGAHSTADQTSAELCAEIQKLNRFRTKIEQCAQDAPGSSTPAVVKLLATNTVDARRLQFYKDRLEQLERKVLVYESSGTVQAQRLADRLQREIELDACVKRLNERVDKLQLANRQLEEERCEFEEAENDARHMLQKLEVELEMLRQRNAELEQMGEAARAHANCLEDTVANAHERIQILEEHKSDLKEKLDMLTSFLPSILMCTEWSQHGGPSATGGNQPMDIDGLDLPASVCECIHRQVVGQYSKTPELVELQRLMDREKALRQNIEHLNRVYGETLETADTVWAQMEADYKQQLAEAGEEINLLRSKIYQLEDRLQNDGSCATERIAQLEESESLLQRQLAKCVREQKQHSEQLLAVQSEFEALSEKYASLKGYMNGPMASNLDRERKKTDAAQEELRMAKAQQQEMADVHRAHLAQLREQLNRTKNELLYINVSNGELKEEVDTLEHRVVELEARRRADEETIRNLSYELHSRHSERPSDSECECGPLSRISKAMPEPKGRRFGGETLAQELQHVASFSRLNAGRVRSDDDETATSDEPTTTGESEEFGDHCDDDGDSTSDPDDIGCHMSRTEL